MKCDERALFACKGRIRFQSRDKLVKGSNLRVRNFKPFLWAVRIVACKKFSVPDTHARQCGRKLRNPDPWTIEIIPHDNFTLLLRTNLHRTGKRRANVFLSCLLLFANRLNCLHAFEPPLLWRIGKEIPQHDREHRKKREGASNHECQRTSLFVVLLHTTIVAHHLKKLSIRYQKWVEGWGVEECARDYFFGDADDFCFEGVNIVLGDSECILSYFLRSLFAFDKGEGECFRERHVGVVELYEKRVEDELAMVAAVGVLGVAKDFIFGLWLSCFVVEYTNDVAFCVIVDTVEITGKFYFRKAFIASPQNVRNGKFRTAGDADRCLEVVEVLQESFEGSLMEARIFLLRNRHFFECTLQDLRDFAFCWPLAASVRLHRMFKDCMHRFTKKE